MDRYHRSILCKGDLKMIGLPYTGFRKFGVETDPPVPLVAVPLLDDVSQVVTEALRVQSRFTASTSRLKTAIDHLQAKGINTKWPYTFFRGESIEHHGLCPSMYRFWPHDYDAEKVECRKTIEAEAVSIMQKSLRCSVDEAHAAARHYGIPSRLVDFTYNPRVAAYFGHPPFNRGEKSRRNTDKVGIFYCLTIDGLADLFGMQGLTDTDIIFYNPGSHWRVPYFAMDLEKKDIVRSELIVKVPSGIPINPIRFKCTTVPSIGRINAQEGLFVQTGTDGTNNPLVENFLWYLLDFASFKWCYYRKDYQYSAPSHNITTRNLFPKDGPRIKRAEQLIDRIRDRYQQKA